MSEEHSADFLELQKARLPDLVTRSGGRISVSEQTKTKMNSDIEYVKSTCRNLREQTGFLAGLVKGIKEFPEAIRMTIPPTASEVDLGEFHANIMLAYRHLEDARMRLGKVIQACEGGVSIYDQAPAPHLDPPR